MLQNFGSDLWQETESTFEILGFHRERNAKIWKINSFEKKKKKKKKNESSSVVIWWFHNR